MRNSLHPCRLLAALILAMLFVTPAAALDLKNLFPDKEVDEQERQQTIERIDEIQDKLQLLQEKLRALERRKAAKEAARLAAEAGEAKLAGPAQVNWVPVDETTASPGNFGLYTYLLYQGTTDDIAAIGILEDFILTIETLAETELPASLANRFLVPVQRPTSSVNLGRQPYDFKLNDIYLKRLGLGNELSSGPVLVSLTEPLDPYGLDEVPPFLAVSLGHQGAQKSLTLAKVWHTREKVPMSSARQVADDLFWQIIEGAGPTWVDRNGGRLVVRLNQP